MGKHTHVKTNDFGDVSAERDPNLGQYFVESEEYRAAKALDNHKCVFVGRTGSGKSAILARIASDHRDDPNFIVVEVNPDKAYLDAIVSSSAFEEAAARDSLAPLIFKLVWHYVIITKVLRAKYGPEGPKRDWSLLHGTDKEAYQFLKRAQELSREDLTLTDTAIAFLEEVKTEYFSFSSSSNSFEVSRENLIKLIRETDRFFEGAFWNVVGGSKLYVLCDDLDQGWDPASSHQQQLLRGLFNVVNEYNMKERVKPVIALRTNILQGLNLPQKEKFDPYVQTVHWNPERLELMLRGRVECYHGVPARDAHKSFFEGDVSGEPLMRWMTRSTLNRPRDLLVLARFAADEAIKDGAPRIYARHLKAALPGYSRDRITALEQEWRYLYPSLVDVCALFAEHLPNDSASDAMEPSAFRDFLLEVCAEATESEKTIWLMSYFDEKDPRMLTEVLYKLGLIVITKDGAEFSFGTHTQLPRLTRDTKFSFHPMFAPGIDSMRPSQDVWES